MVLYEDEQPEGCSSESRRQDPRYEFGEPDGRGRPQGGAPKSERIEAAREQQRIELAQATMRSAVLARQMRAETAESNRSDESVPDPEAPQEHVLRQGGPLRSPEATRTTRRGVDGAHGSGPAADPRRSGSPRRVGDGRLPARRDVRWCAVPVRRCATPDRVAGRFGVDPHWRRLEDGYAARLGPRDTIDIARPAGRWRKVDPRRPQVGWQALGKAVGLTMWAASLGSLNCALWPVIVI